LLNQQASALVAATTTPPAGPSAEDLVRHATDAFFRFVEQNPYAWRMLFRDPPADAETATVHAAIHRRSVAAIVGMIALARKLRFTLPIPRERANEMLAHTIKAGNEGLAAWWYEHPEVPRDQVVEIAVSLTWHGIAHLAGLDQFRQETEGILSDDEALADLRQSRDDFATGDTFSTDQIRAELDRRRGTPSPRVGSDVGET
jgi:hypothetical protein